MTSPGTTGVIVKRMPSNSPVVNVGAPWHFWISPWMPPQIWRSATLELWKSRVLRTRAREAQCDYRLETEWDVLRARALDVKDLLLADFDRRGARTDEEHGECVEDGSELHLELTCRNDGGRAGDG